MEFYRNSCRSCSKFVWRKIGVEKICVEKKLSIWGLDISNVCPHNNVNNITSRFKRQLVPPHLFAIPRKQAPAGSRIFNPGIYGTGFYKILGEGSLGIWWQIRHQIWWFTKLGDKSVTKLIINHRIRWPIYHQIWRRI